MVTLETKLAWFLSGKVFIKKNSLAEEESVTVNFWEWDLSRHGYFVK